MVRLVDITAHNYVAYYRLRVFPEQRVHVAENPFTLVQAHYEPGARLFGLENHGRAVGLLMYKVLDRQDAVENLRGLQTDGEAFLWRFMVADEHQSGGLGRQGLALFADKMVTSFGCTRIYVTHSQAAGNPRVFYEKCGFIDTGRRLNDECLLVKTLAK